jgi:cyclophilin family peptidyl-prolyl cis-trans isomerase
MVVPGYMIIGGDPKGDGTGGPGYWLKPEYNSLPHLRGAFGMSHPPFAPADIGSQFYVMLTNSMRESNAYPVFGYVEKGMDVCDRIGEIPSSGVNGKPPWKPQTLITIQEIKLMVLEGK